VGFLFVEQEIYTRIFLARDIPARPTVNRIAAAGEGISAA